MKVSALYGGRLSEASQNHVVTTAEKNQEILSNTTQMAKEARAKFQKPEPVVEVPKTENVKDSDTSEVDQKLGLGQNFDTTVEEN